MKPTDLRAAVEAYLDLRRALGFKLRTESWILSDCVAFFETHGASFITTALALRWAQQPPDGSPYYWAKRLSTVRCFARHHRVFDPRTEVPPPLPLPFCTQRRRPYIYTDEEVALLMREARDLPGTLRSESYATLVGLLAATGMRVGEAIALDDEDLDWRRSLVTVRHAKFQKSRHVLLHQSTLAALRVYTTLRDRLYPRRHSRSFFVSGVGTRIHIQNFQLVFLRLLRVAGLDTGPGRRPRIHDLRHAFALKTLSAWYRSGVDAERRLPWLSTYLGHVSPAATYRYLTATPELLALAGERLDRAWEVRP